MNQKNPRSNKAENKNKRKKRIFSESELSFAWIKFYACTDLSERLDLIGMIADTYTLRQGGDAEYQAENKRLARKSRILQAQTAFEFGHTPKSAARLATLLGLYGEMVLKEDQRTALLKEAKGPKGEFSQTVRDALAATKGTVEQTRELVKKASDEFLSYRANGLY